MNYEIKWYKARAIKNHISVDTLDKAICLALDREAKKEMTRVEIWRGSLKVCTVRMII